MLERFTDRARKAMAFANQEAQRFRHEYIGTEHILLGLIREGTGVGANVLNNLGVNLNHIRAEVDKLVRHGQQDVGVGKLPQSPQAKKVIEYAIEEARGLNHHYVGTEHLLLALIREQDGVAATVLLNLGLKPEGVRREVLHLLGGGGDSAQGTEGFIYLNEHAGELGASGLIEHAVKVLNLAADQAGFEGNDSLKAELQSQVERLRALLTGR